MFVRLLALFKEGKIDEVSLDTAVYKRWITEEEKNQIIVSRSEE
ncbi:MAG: hypothetical protein K0R92_511 [Lachnospiraceae bacterium]|jgi:hypothetical protein|nr:hypothetical protein [Lachnospiraceae bacterium]